MPRSIVREIRKIRNGMTPQIPLDENEQVLYSEVCSVKTDGNYAESLVTTTSQRLLIEPWRKRATHKIISIPYAQIQCFYKKALAPVIGILFNKYLVVETEKEKVFIMTQKSISEQFIRHLQYFTGKKLDQ